MVPRLTSGDTHFKQPKWMEGGKVGSSLPDYALSKNDPSHSASSSSSSSSGRGNETAVVILSPSFPLKDSSFSTSLEGEGGFLSPSSRGVKALEQTLDSVIEGLGGEGKVPEGIRVIVAQEGDEEAVEEFMIANYNKNVGFLHNRATFSAFSTSSSTFASSSTSSSTTPSLTSPFSNSSNLPISISRHNLFTLQKIFDKHQFEKALFLEAGMEVTHAFFEQLTQLSREIEGDKLAKTCILSWGGNSGGGGLCIQDASLFEVSDFEKKAWFVKRGLWKEYGKEWVVKVKEGGKKSGKEEGSCTASNVFAEWQRGFSEKGTQIAENEGQKGSRTSVYSE